MFRVFFFCMVDDFVRKIKDGLGTPVVFLQLKDSCSRKLFRKIHDIFKIRPAEGVDTLGIITDHHHVLMHITQQSDDARLDLIGILIFIHQDVSKGLRQLAPDICL